MQNVLVNWPGECNVVIMDGVSTGGARAGATRRMATREGNSGWLFKCLITKTLSTTNCVTEMKFIDKCRSRRHLVAGYVNLLCPYNGCKNTFGSPLSTMDP